MRTRSVSAFSAPSTSLLFRCSHPQSPPSVADFLLRRRQINLIVHLSPPTTFDSAIPAPIVFKGSALFGEGLGKIFLQHAVSQIFAFLLKVCRIRSLTRKELMLLFAILWKTISLTMFRLRLLTLLYWRVPAMKRALCKPLNTPTQIFMLSAISPEKMPFVIRSVKEVLKPNSYVLLRDYAIGDFAQILVPCHFQHSLIANHSCWVWNPEFC